MGKWAAGSRGGGGDHRVGPGRGRPRPDRAREERISGNDSTFGFFTGGLAASMPLKFIPAAFGNWQARASVMWLQLNDNLKTVNNGDSTEFIGTFGIAMTY